jgi:ABC-type transport system involved in multi-copper enzyme maturation permease subunit
MIRLLKVEANRFLSRRMLRVITLLLVAAFLLTAGLILRASENSPEAVRASRNDYLAEVDRCRANAIDDGRSVAYAEASCAVETDGGDPRFKYVDAEWIVLTLGLPIVMLALLIGSSSVGAEWNQRTMTSMLTWETRRGRVLAAKAIVPALLTTVWAFVMMAFFAGILYPVAVAEGSVAGVDGHFWVDLVGSVARAASLAGLASLLGLSLAFIGRNTAAALGATFGYLAIVEGLIRAFRPGWVGWLIGDNANQWVTGEVLLSHSQTASALLLLVYAAALVLLAGTFFQRREVA